MPSRWTFLECCDPAAYYPIRHGAEVKQYSTDLLAALILLALAISFLTAPARSLRVSMVADGLRGRGRGREATEARGPICTLHPSAESLRSAMFGGSVVVRQGEIVGAHRACQPHLDTPHS